jgi:uncharacterized protein (UPF0303 family)
VDIYVNARLSYDDLSATLECSFERQKPRTATIVGTKGSIVIEELHRPQRAVITLEDGTEQALDVPYVVDDFYGEIHHFCELLRAGKTESPVMSLDASIGCAHILDVIRSGFTPTEETLRVLEEQERLLRYPKQFGAQEALALGNRIAQLAADYDRGITVQINRTSDDMQLFGWSMDDKAPRNYGYVAGKRGSTLNTGHASCWLQAKLISEGRSDELYAHMPDIMPAAGCFPIRVAGSDEIVATCTVSGLHEGYDHELALRALEAELGTQAPALKTIVS